jgi:hypothetical protein
MENATMHSDESAFEHVDLPDPGEVATIRYTTPRLTPEEGRAVWDAVYGPGGPYHPDGAPRR